MRLTQTGFDRVGADADEFRAGYQSGWREVLGWFAEQVQSRNGGTP